MHYLKNIFVVSIAVFGLTKGFAQKVPVKLKFNQGQQLDITMQTKTTIVQEAMGQSIDFNIDGVAKHAYKVTNATDDNSTLHHEMKFIGFSFDGMGQKRKFASDNEKDMKGEFGKPVKEMMEKTYDIIIDPTGTTMMVQPPSMEKVKMDERMRLITDMLKDVLETVQPPAKGAYSFFKVFTNSEVGLGDTWSDSQENESGKTTTNYTLSAITDSTIVVDLSGTATSTNKAEMMGMETLTKMNLKTSGKIIVDKATGIILQKMTNIESTGTTEVMGTTLPITSKSTITIDVKK